MQFVNLLGELSLKICQHISHISFAAFISLQQTKTLEQQSGKQSYSTVLLSSASGEIAYTTRFTGKIC